MRKKQFSKAMSELAKRKNKKMTKTERSAHGRMMIKARWDKKKLST